MARARFLFVVSLLLGACTEEPPLLWIAVDVPEGMELAREDLEFEQVVVIHDTVERFPRGWAFAIVAEALPDHLKITTGGRTCPSSLTLKDREVGERIDVTLRRWFEVDTVEAQVGWSSEVRVDATPGCLEALRGRLSWSHVSGPELVDPEERRQGFLLTATTAPMPEELEERGGWGIIPVSPRTRGTTVLEASYDGPEAQVEPVRVAIHANARTTGLPSVPLGHRIVLSDHGWTVTSRPEEARGEIEEAALVSLRPDRSGEWMLTDANDRELLLRVGRFDETPLDCGRAECHAAESAASANNPMTSVLSRGMEGDLGDAWSVGCAQACHATGEPGLGDGGFGHLARDLRVTVHERSWQALPRAMRRVGGVSCTACHGPGAIPAEESRWAILRSDVCAVCHDAPPRYGHHVALETGAMGRADADTPARTEASCVRCHTTHGFLADIGVREQPSAPPPQAGAVGMGCATCHAPHGDHVGIALLRDAPIPELLTSVEPTPPPESRVCLSCHTPRGEEIPAAAQAAVLWGVGAVSPSTGEPVHIAGPHAAAERGCIGCHRSGPEELERGASHAFAVDDSACAACHQEPVELDESLQSRIDAAYEQLKTVGAIEVPRRGSPHGRATLIADPNTPLGRAARSVLLLRADPAAAIHNPAYVSGVLDQIDLDALTTRDPAPR